MVEFKTRLLKEKDKHQEKILIHKTQIQISFIAYKQQYEICLSMLANFKDTTAYVV